MDERADAYAPGYADDALRMLAARTPVARAGSLLRHLRAGMRVLDVGCGPGTITLGLAGAVAPGGSVVGLDAEPSQVEIARAAAGAAGVGNMVFEAGSVYALPYGHASFDAVFAHGLFEHLARPLAAFSELRRVLRPGGVAVAVSSDWSAAVVEPRDADVDEALSWHFELRRRAGGDRQAGRPRRPGGPRGRLGRAVRRQRPLPRRASGLHRQSARGRGTGCGTRGSPPDRRCYGRGVSLAAAAGRGIHPVLGRRRRLARVSFGSAPIAFGLPG